MTTNLEASWYYVVGVHFPRRMSDAYAFEELAASTTSESFTVPSLGLVPLGECRLASDYRTTPGYP
jgi:hypothetical protein